MSDRSRIYIHTPRWFLRPKNTDWVYTRFRLRRISEFVPECEFVVSQSIATMVRTNFSYAYRTACRKIGKPAESAARVVVDLREFRRSGCDAVFCHDDFPRNTAEIPVIWQNSILDPEMTLAYGGSEAELVRSRDEKGDGFRRAAVVQVSSEAEKARLGCWFPEIADRFVAVPFFLPDVRAISLERLEEKLARGGPLRCLFVGHEARRKGLARIYDALTHMRGDARERLQMTVVSTQADGAIAAPSLPNLRVVPGLPHDQVLQLMRESDVLVMPSLYESYGLAYLEAMAQGTIPIVPNWEVQRELVDYGRAGVVTSGDPADLAQWLERLSEDAQFRAGLARAARQRFETEYAPQAVAGKFTAMAARFSQ